MKKNVSFFSHAILLTVACIFLLGCPAGVDYALADKPMPIDRALLGKWEAQTEDAEMLLIQVDRLTSDTYGVDVLEEGDEYLLGDTYFNAHVTTIDGHKFIYAQMPNNDDKDYYIYHYHFEDNGKLLVLQDVSFLVGGMDAAKSTATLRSEISASLKKEGCLSERREYVKAD